MKRFVGVLLLFAATCACASPLGKTISLTESEKAQAINIAEDRQELSFQMARAQASYQAQMDRLNEENQQLNIKANILCFQFRKAHKLDPGVNYTLDEWKGELVRR